MHLNQQEVTLIMLKSFTTVVIIFVIFNIHVHLYK